MKILLFCLLFAVNAVEKPLTITDVEKQHKTTPEFKYVNDQDPSLVFTILAYWEKTNGVVYSFYNNGLVASEKFLNRNEYINFITPPAQKYRKYVIASPPELKK